MSRSLSCIIYIEKLSLASSCELFFRWTRVIIMQYIFKFCGAESFEVMERIIHEYRKTYAARRSVD